jgi:heat shock protein beta
LILLSDLYLSTFLSLVLWVLQELVHRYSQFISFPIYLWASKEIEDEVDVIEEEAAATIGDVTSDEEISVVESEDKGLEEADETEDEPNIEKGEK